MDMGQGQVLLVHKEFLQVIRSIMNFQFALTHGSKTSMLIESEVYAITKREPPDFRQPLRLDRHEGC